MRDLPNSTKSTVIVIGVSLLLILLLKWVGSLITVEQPAAGNDRFGLAFISAPDDLADEARYQGALATGARWDRWPLYWHWVAEGGYAGPHQGGVHDYDTLISQELEHGLTPLVILMGTPAGEAKTAVEAESGPLQDQDLPPLKENTLAASTATLPPRSLFEPIFADGTDDFGPGQAINPANAWADFVFKTVERYRPEGILAKWAGWPKGAGVRHWEIWNEPDFASFWQGSVEEYARLLEVAYKSIKTADPEATVVLGGLAFYEKPNWLPSLLRQTGGDPNRIYFDVLSMHHYWSIYNSEDRIQQFRAALDAFGLEAIPIWMTESGVSVWDDYPATAYDVPPDEPWRATMAEQANYLIQNAALAFYNGVERYYHFMLHDDCGDGPSSAYGLRQNFTPHVCNPAQGRPRPAYAAYQLAAEQFTEISPLWREQTPAYDQVAFYRPADRARLVVVWATQGVTATATISATGPGAALYWIESQETISGTTGLSRTLSLSPDDGVYALRLPPATNRNFFKADDPRYHIGGRPYLLVERDTLPPKSNITPLPPASPPEFLVTWQGEDPGSGIASYEVWVGEDDEPLREWLAGTTATRAKFTGQPGHRYRFAVRAVDQAGNEAAWPDQLQAATLVTTGPAVTGIVLGPAGESVAEATVIVAGANTQETVMTGENGFWSPLLLPAGEYTFEATAPHYGVWPAPRRIALEPPAMITVTLAPPANQMAAGDFEGNQVWSSWDWSGQVNLTIDAFDGQAAARLGEGTGEPVPCPDDKQSGQQWALRQAVAVPAGGEPVLSFLYKIATSQLTFSEAWLAVYLSDEDQQHDLIAAGELWQSSDWRLKSLDLSPWQGQTVEIQFQVIHCSEQPFKATLDRVSVGG